MIKILETHCIINSIFHSGQISNCYLQRTQSVPKELTFPAVSPTLPMCAKISTTFFPLVWLSMLCRTFLQKETKAVYRSRSELHQRHGNWHWILKKLTSKDCRFTRKQKNDTQKKQNGSTTKHSSPLPATPPVSPSASILFVMGGP